MLKPMLADDAAIVAFQQHVEKGREDAAITLLLDSCHSQVRSSIAKSTAAHVYRDMVLSAVDTELQRSDGVILAFLRERCSELLTGSS